MFLICPTLRLRRAVKSRQSRQFDNLSWGVQKGNPGLRYFNRVAQSSRLHKKLAECNVIQRYCFVGTRGTVSLLYKFRYIKLYHRLLLPQGHASTKKILTIFAGSVCKIEPDLKYSLPSDNTLFSLFCNLLFFFPYGQTFVICQR